MDIDVDGDAAIVRGRPFAVVVLGIAAGHLALAQLASTWTVDGLVTEPVWFAAAFTAAGSLLVRAPRRPWVLLAGTAAQLGHGFIEGRTGGDLAGDITATAVEVVAASLLFAVVFDRTRGLGFHATTGVAFGVSVGVAALGGVVAGVVLAGDDGFGRWFWAWTSAHALGMVVVGATLMLFRESRGWRAGVAMRAFLSADQTGSRHQWQSSHAI